MEEKLAAADWAMSKLSIAQVMAMLDCSRKVAKALRDAAEARVVARIEATRGNVVELAPAATKPSRRKLRALLPEAWEAKDSHVALAKELGVNLPRELAKFRDHAAYQERRCSDWDAAFRNWLRKSAELLARTRPPMQARPAVESVGDRLARGRAMMAQEAAERARKLQGGS